MSRIYLDKNTGKLTRCDLYLVDLTLSDGQVFEKLEPRRLFPVTNGEGYITLLDENEKEVALVRHLSDLDEASAAVLRACFDEYYRVPVITALLDCTDRFGNLVWVVETDRGQVKFRIRNRHNDIKHLPGNRILVRDSNDNRYQIPDYTALDNASKRRMYSYL